jgi:glyoxalase/bleomycin resistance protein/dioxygenase superfamily protein
VSNDGGRPRGLHHIGYWVDDLDAGMASATQLLGVGPFTVLEHIDLGDFHFRGGPGNLDHSAAFAAWGPVLLELNCFHSAEPPELLAALGVKHGAVSHVSWTTDDLVGEGEHLEAAGCALITTSVGGAVANWFTGGPLFGHAVEIHQPPQRVLDFWASIRKAAAD